jgi:hypothetical protein
VRLTFASASFAVVSATAPPRSSPWIRNARFASLSVTPALGGLSERPRVFRNEIDLRLAAAEREPEEGEQVHPAVLERREDPLALSGRIWNGHVVVLDASYHVGHRGPPPRTRCYRANDTPPSCCPDGSVSATRSRR